MNAQKNEVKKIYCPFCGNPSVIDHEWFNDATSKINELQTRAEAAEARAAELLRRLEDSQAHVGKLEAEREEAQRQLEQAQAELAEYKRAHEYAWKNVLDDALNSGDGVYRP